MTARERAMLAVLRECETALQVWCVTYASDQCSEEAVKNARKWIRDHGGTVAYIGTLLDKIRAHTGRKRGTKA